MLWAGAGMCARRRSNFLSLRRKKVTKERATLLCVSLRCATGNLRCSVRGCAAELTARCALRSNNCGKSVHEVRVSFGTRTHPLPCASRHAQKGTQRTSIRAIALLGPVCAARGTCASEVGPSEAMARVAVRLSTPLLAAPAAGWLRGGMGVEAPMLRALTRRGCPSGAAQQQSEFHGAPRNRPAAGCPFAPRRGRRLGVAFFCLLFLATQEKKVRRRAHIPAPALGKGMLPNQRASPGFDKLSPNGRWHCTQKLLIS